MWSPTPASRWVCPSMIQTDTVWRVASSHQPWLHNHLQVQWLKPTAWISLKVHQCDSVMIVSLQTAGVCGAPGVPASARVVQTSLFSITLCIVRYVMPVRGRQVRVGSVMLWMKRPWTLHGRGIPWFSRTTLPPPHDKDLRVVPPDFLDLNSLSIAGIFWKLHCTDSRTQTQY